MTAGLGSSVSNLAEEVAYAPPVGCLRIEAPGSRTSLVSVPLLRPAAYVGRIARVGAGTLRIAATNLVVNRFRPGPQESFYAEVTTGALAGVLLQIVSNTSNELTLDTGGIALTAHPLGTIRTDVYNAQFALTTPGETVVIRPYWTIGQLLGATEPDLAIEPFSSTAEAEGLAAGDRVLIPNRQSLGFEQPADASLFFVQGAGWRKQGAGENQAGFPLDPRHPALLSRGSSGAVTLLISGEVPITRAATRIPGTDATQGREVFLSTRLAEPISLADSGIWNSDPLRSVVKASPSLLIRVDELQSFADLDSDHGLEPEQRRVFVTNQGWMAVGENTSQFQLVPGRGYRLRLRAGSPGGWWLENPNY